MCRPPCVPHRVRVLGHPLEGDISVTVVLYTLGCFSMERKTLLRGTNVNQLVFQETPN